MIFRDEYFVKFCIRAQLRDMLIREHRITNLDLILLLYRKKGHLLKKMRNVYVGEMGDFFSGLTPQWPHFCYISIPVSLSALLPREADPHRHAPNKDQHE